MSYNPQPIILDVRSFGAIPDCRRLTDVVATSGAATITSATAAWTSSDVGKLITLYDFTNSNYIFRGTLLSVQSGTNATMSGNASASLLAANCIGYIGTNNSTAITSAMAVAQVNISPTSQGANLSLGGGDAEVIFPSDSRGNMYAIGSQVVIPTNVTIDADAMLVSFVGSADTNVHGLAARTFAMVFMPGANIRNLQMFCNYTMGIVIGTYTQQSHSRIDWLTLWDVGGNNSSGSIATTSNVNAGGSSYVVGDTVTLTGGTGTKAVLTVQAVTAGAITAAYVSTPGNYSVLPTNPVSQGSSSGSGTGATFNLTFADNSHIGFELSGNDYFINQFWVKGANMGLELNQANDVMINHLFLIGCGTGLRIKGAEEVLIGSIQIDTGSFAGVTIDSSHNVHLRDVNAFSINATGLTYGIGLGQNDASNPCRGIWLDASFNRCGGDAVRIGNVSDSRFKFNVTNSALYGAGGVAITNAVNFTGAAAATGNILTDLTVGTTGSGTITAKTGTGYGMFLLNGNPLYSVQAPSTGFTITIDSATPNLILNPAGTLSTGTINMPATPMDGMKVSVGSDQIVTTLTVAGNGNTIKNAPTTIAAGGTFAYQYNLSATTWFRIQ